jgi:prephenate dehydrogenase
MGCLVANVLKSFGVVPAGIDIVEPGRDSPYEAFVKTDLTAASCEATTLLAGASCVIACVPTAVALHVVPLVATTMAPGGLWVDTVPVKQPICRALAQFDRIEALSLNPLFAPDLGFVNQNVIAVQVKQGPRAEWFLEVLKAAGAEVSTLTAMEHDRLTASIQVAAHTALLCFGLTVQRAHPTAPPPFAQSTPPYRLLMSLLSRIASAHAHVYWDIQRGHPYGSETRAALADAVADLSRIVDSNNEEAFLEMVHQLRTSLQLDRRELERIVRSATRLSH